MVLNCCEFVLEIQRFVLQRNVVTKKKKYVIHLTGIFCIEIIFSSSSKSRSAYVSAMRSSSGWRLSFCSVTASVKCSNNYICDTFELSDEDVSIVADLYNRLDCKE